MKQQSEKTLRFTLIILLLFMTLKSNGQSEIFSLDKNTLLKNKVSTITKRYYLKSGKSRRLEEGDTFSTTPNEVIEEYSFNKLGELIQFTFTKDSITKVTDLEYKTVDGKYILYKKTKINNYFKTDSLDISNDSVNKFIKILFLHPEIIYPLYKKGGYYDEIESTNIIDRRCLDAPEPHTGTSYFTHKYLEQKIELFKSDQQGTLEFKVSDVVGRYYNSNGNPSAGCMIKRDVFSGKETEERYSAWFTPEKKIKSEQFDGICLFLMFNYKYLDNELLDDSWHQEVRSDFKTYKIKYKYEYY